ncbi:hypothetical protein MMPV_008209 [Pyropia vietnamensis]
MWRRALGVATVEEDGDVGSSLGGSSYGDPSGGSVLSTDEAGSEAARAAAAAVPRPVAAAVPQPVAAAAAAAAAVDPDASPPSAGTAVGLGGGGGRVVSPRLYHQSRRLRLELAGVVAAVELVALVAGTGGRAVGNGSAADVGAGGMGALPPTMWQRTSSEGGDESPTSDEETELFNNTTVHMDYPGPETDDDDDDDDNGGDAAAASGDGGGFVAEEGFLGSLLASAAGSSGGARATKAPSPPSGGLAKLSPRGSGSPPRSTAAAAAPGSAPIPPRRWRKMVFTPAPPLPPMESPASPAGSVSGSTGSGGGSSPPPVDALDDDGVGDEEELSREELLRRLQRARARLRTWEGAGRELLYGLVLNAEMNAVYAGMLREQLHIALSALPSVSSVEYLEASLPSVPREAPRMTLVSWEGLGHSTWDVAFSPRSWWVRARLTGASTRTALRLLSFSVELSVTDVAVRGRLRVALSSDLSAVRLSWAAMPAVEATVTSAVGWGTLPLPLQAGPLEARVLAEARRWIRRRLVAPASMMVVLKRHRPPAAGLSDEDVSAAAAAAARAVVRSGLPSLF